MGDKGALLYHGDNYEIFPGFKVKVVDTTAAGDSFTAAMALKMVEHGDMKKAIEYANGAAAISVSRRGAQPSLPTSKDVSEFFSRKSLDMK